MLSEMHKEGAENQFLEKPAEKTDDPVMWTDQELDHGSIFCTPHISITHEKLNQHLHEYAVV